MSNRSPAKRRHRARYPDSSQKRWLRQSLIKRDGLICWLCEQRINPGLPREHREAMTLDHVTALADGGSNELANMRLAHYRCNHARHAEQKSAAAGQIHSEDEHA